MALGRIYSGLARGKSVGRALQNDALAPHLSELSGRVLDLAGGSGSYYAYLPTGLDTVRTNREGQGGDTVDMNERLPYADASFDAVLLLNALYIAPRPQEVLVEVRRVLKPGGTLILATPFLYNEMREPHDYWRFTSEGLELMTREAGFKDTQLTPVGERFTTVVSLQCFGPLHLLAFFSLPLALLFDRCLPRSFRTRHPAPLGYVTVARA